MNNRDEPLRVDLVVVSEGDLRRIVREEIASALADGGPTQWVGAKTSPLPRRLFLRLCSTGELPAVKVGRTYKAKRRDVDVWLERQRVVPEQSEAAEDPVERELAAGRLRVVKAPRK